VDRDHPWAVGEVLGVDADLVCAPRLQSELH